MEVKSLLVHSDGECAVVLVIDSNHSPLDKRRDLERETEREREEAKERKRARARKKQRGDTSHSHFPFLPSCPPHSHIPRSRFS